MDKTCSICNQKSYIEINGRWYCEKCGNVESLPTVDENAELRAKLAAAEKREAELAQGIIVNCKLCRKYGVGRLPGACEKCPTSLIEATALENQKGK